VAAASTLFVSDLHLSRERPGIVTAFEAFATGPAREAEALYVLGDLVDAWLGDDVLDADPFAARIAAAFGALSASGVKLFFQHGNRDFLLRDEFARRAGGTLLPGEQVRDLYGTPTLLLHGDELCTDDVSYQALRRQVRDRAWQEGFLARPLGERIAQARGLREASDAAKAGKDMAIMDASEAAVIAAFRRHGVRRMIHGHTHRPARHIHMVDGVACERHVLADWYERASFLRCDASGCETHVLP
jgi:UDP-2,3-diacylglucosamine hydrolase